MTQEELILELNKIGVNSSSYSLGVLKNSDCVSVVKENCDWVVYYTERNHPEKLGTFESCSEAYYFVLEEFKKWRL